ncbi:MAG: hypothetical protein GX825_04115 [Syntrophomonadaceae bacterium]|nr:hypothetical protein [Syntrophomonadaceae bacterium]
MALLVAPVGANDTIVVITRSVEYIADYVMQRFESNSIGGAEGQNERYATMELIAIDGIPWQDNKYAEERKKSMEFGRAAI